MGQNIEPKILPCNCKHEQQDAMYGKGMRLHNPGGKGKDYGTKWYCTVCSGGSGYRAVRGVDGQKIGRRFKASR